MRDDGGRNFGRCFFDFFDDRLGWRICAWRVGGGDFGGTTTSGTTAGAVAGAAGTGDTTAAGAAEVEDKLAAVTELVSCARTTQRLTTLRRVTAKLSYS